MNVNFHYIQLVLTNPNIEKPKHIIITPVKLEPFLQSKINYTQPTSEKNN